MRKNARGRPGASEGKARTCAHATQREPALVEENWSAEVKSGPCVAARFACLCVVPARNTPPEQICTRAKAKRDANQLATKHEYSMSLHRNITSADRFAKGKDRDGFLAAAMDRPNRKCFVNQLITIWWGSCLDAYDHQWPQTWPATA